VYTDEDTLRQFGRLTRIYAALAANYTRAAVRQNAAQHTPVMRPLFLMFEDDPQSFLQASLKTKYVVFFLSKSLH
jgi:alpha-glucosidase